MVNEEIQKAAEKNALNGYGQLVQGIAISAFKDGAEWMRHQLDADTRTTGRR